MRISTAIALVAALALSMALVGCGSEEPGAAPKIDAAQSEGLRNSGGDKIGMVEAKE